MVIVRIRVRLGVRLVSGEVFSKGVWGAGEGVGFLELLRKGK